MSDDFPNRQSIRLSGYDYSQNGLYFCTICTQNRENSLGEIKSGKMVLNNVGKLTDRCWKEIFNKFPCIELDEFQIMPNHIHAMVKLVGARSSRPNDKNIHTIPTLGQIIAYFKYTSTKLINNLPGGKTPPLHNHIRNLKFWQRNYFEHIIRNEPEYDKIRYYIIHNPELWDRDRNNLKK